MSHIRVPVRFIQHNDELLKSMSGGAGECTDYKSSDNLPEAAMEPTYRLPVGRVNGNEFFRRYPNGSLDYHAAKDVVLEALFKVKNGIQPNGVEAIALSVLFPSVFDYVDQSMLPEYTATSLRLHPEEAIAVSQLVAEHLAELMNYMSHKRQ